MVATTGVGSPACGGDRGAAVIRGVQVTKLMTAVRSRVVFGVMRVFAICCSCSVAGSIDDRRSHLGLGWPLSLSEHPREPS